MDMDDELQKAKWLLTAFVIFLIAGYFSFGELRYLVWGETVDAEVTEVRETVRSGGRYRRAQPALSVRYSFEDEEGESHRGSTVVSTDWEQPDGPVAVRYIPGDPEKSRLADQRRDFTLVIFFVMLAAVIGFVIKMWREASAAVNSPSSRRR